MTVRNLLLIAITATLVAALPGAASANLWGKSKIGCPTTGQIARIDPLASPGGVAGHEHTFSGARNITSTTTTADLLNGTSTCFLNSDHAGIWAPTVIKDGVSYGAGASYYLAGNGADPAQIAGGRIQTPPNGLRFIIGDSHSTTLQSTNYLRWRCGEGDVYSSLDALSANCSTYFYMELDAPNCWDGMRLDSPNHQDHMTIGYASCPASHPVRVPQVQIAFAYSPAALGGRLSSDEPGAPAGSSAHADYWFANGPEVEQLTRCLNDPHRDSPNSPSCGVLTYFSTNPGTPYEQPNPWRVAMTQWSGIGYVFADGSPNGPPPVGTP